MIEKKYSYNKDPFPYIIFDNFLDKHEIEELENCISHEIFSEVSDDKFRHNINYSHPYFKKIKKKNLILKKFCKKIIKKKSFEFLLNIFNRDLREENFFSNLEKYHIYAGKNFNPKNLNYYDLFIFKIFNKFFKVKNFIFKLLKIPSVRIDLEFAESWSGYNLPAHKDQVNKVFVGLLYLNTMKNENDKFISNLNLFKRHDQKKKKISVKPSEEEIYKYSEVNVIKNKCIIFLNTPYAYHSVEEFTSKTPRKFVYFSYAISNYKDLFKEN